MHNPAEYFEKEKPPVNLEQQQQAQHQPQPLTPEQYSEGLKQADALVERWGLNEGSEKFSAQLSSFTEIDFDRCQSFSNTFSRSFVSAREDFLAAGGDIEKLRPLSPLEVRDTNKAVADFFGIDLQMRPAVNPEAVAHIYRLGICNLFDTMVRTPGVTDVTQLNDKRMCVWFCEALGNALTGNVAETDERVAVQLVNLMAQRIVNDFIPKARSAAPGNAGSRQRSNSAPRRANFRTNADIFTPNILERLDLERATNRQGDFSPKSRKAVSRFSSNQDIFDEETMAEFDLRRL